MDGMKNDEAIDVDDLATWPEPLSELVGNQLMALEGTPDHASDLRPSDWVKPKLLDVLRGRQLVAYHCTRLLPHELEMVRTQGLRELSPELVQDRLQRARDVGALSESQFELLTRSHVFSVRDDSAQSRRGLVCVVIGRSLFDDEPRACRPLLSTWGGECLYMADGPQWESVRRCCQKLGLPALVGLRLDVSSLERSGPSLDKVLIGRALGLKKPWADGFIRGSVRRDQIDAVWQPGDAEYDRHGGLPRE